MTNDSTPVMLCVVCGKEIGEGEGHYRIAAARIHCDCIRTFWHPPSNRDDVPAVDDPDGRSVTPQHLQRRTRGQRGTAAKSLRATSH